MIKNTQEKEFFFGIRIITKALAMFIVANVLFSIYHPTNSMGRLSAYNFLFPGRQRLPYGDDPDVSYNLSLYNLEAMFSSHELTAKIKPPDEYRVILIGDSSTWGFLLPPEQTSSTYMNREGLKLPDGRNIRVYNLGYPVMSLTKDLLLLSYAMRYNPDVVIWLLTLESFPYDKQLFPPLLQNNPEKVRALIKDYRLNLDPQDSQLAVRTFWDETIIGSRRELADLLRLQLYGVLWAATGIDQYIPESYALRQENLTADDTFHNLNPPHLKESDLAFDVLRAGIKMTGDVPVLLINEPMFISKGQNSHIRYNFFYPRWAYDDYRLMMEEESISNGWKYWDMWDSIAPTEFTNSAIHLTSSGSKQFANLVLQAIVTTTSQEPESQ
jgi:hypothetical protein